MKVLVLGNGFDLYHKLPTRYIDFLRVILRLEELKKEGKECNYIAYMFGEKSPLYQEDTFIQDSYKFHKDVIDKTQINQESIEELMLLAEKNIWLEYFKNIKKNIGWIDFEKEISKILMILKKVFDEINKQKIFYGVVELGETENVSVSELDCLKLLGIFNTKERYYSSTLEFPLNLLKNSIWDEEADYKMVNEEMIINWLFNDLVNFTKMIEIYINEFINKILIHQTSHNKLFEMPDYVISFNYTNYFAKLYGISDMNNYIHIHGQVEKNNLVLGINANEEDEILNIDTRFIRFKKYFQRIWKNTNKEYLKFMRDCNNKLLRVNKKIETHFIGHSLDVTDNDIITEIINTSDNTIIHYHDHESYGIYIENLITLFGKKQFLSMYISKKIVFEELPAFELENK